MANAREESRQIVSVCIEDTRCECEHSRVLGKVARRVASDAIEELSATFLDRHMLTEIDRGKRCRKDALLRREGQLVPAIVQPGDDLLTEPSRRQELILGQPNGVVDPVR